MCIKLIMLKYSSGSDVVCVYDMQGSGMSGKMEVVIRTPISLYRYLLRSVSLLPKDAQYYYKHRIRQVSTH